MRLQDDFFLFLNGAEHVCIQLDRRRKGHVPEISSLLQLPKPMGRHSARTNLSMIFLLFGAGQETTTHLISGGLFALLSHEGQLRQLRSDPGLIPTCVEDAFATYRRCR